MVITDVGHEFDIKLQMLLALWRPTSLKCLELLYYENLESFVPGGYSATFAKVAEKANIIVFANRALANAKIYSEPGNEINLSYKAQYGIGYYPVDSAEAILQRRKREHNVKRAEFFADQGIEDKGQKILVYFGGNNTEYFSKAFPAFLSFLPKDSEDILVVLQQHPGAKENNLDGALIKDWNEGEES